MESAPWMTKKGNAFTPISVKLTVEPDGAEPVVQYYNAGFLYGDNKVSKDGQSIVGEDNFVLDGGTQWGRFILSLTFGKTARPGGDAASAAPGRGWP